MSLREWTELAEDLEAVGIEVTTVYDLVNRSDNDYRAAVPILLRHLESARDPKLREGIVRALGVKSFPVTEALIAAFRRESHPLVRWAIGNSLYNTASREHIPALLELVQDRSYGIARQMIALQLGKWRDPGALAALERLVDDPEVTPHALTALGEYEDERLRSLFVRLATHAQPLVRKSAARSLARLERRGVEAPSCDQQS